MFVENIKYLSKRGGRGMSDLKYDIIIIGAGVSGCAVARELSRYDLKNLCAG